MPDGSGGDAREPDPSAKVMDDYRRNATKPGLRPVLDVGDEGDVKNAYLDYVHRRLLRRHLPALGTRMADLACGIGRLTGMAAEQGTVVGVDLSADLLTLARTNLGSTVPLIRGDLTALPLQSGSLTGAMMCFAALHLGDDAAGVAFAEVARVLQPGGVFLLFTHVSPDAESRLYHGVVNRPVARVEQLLGTAGLEVYHRVDAKKTPSRPVHWVIRGRLPRWLWGLGAWLDGFVCGRALEHTDYVETLFLARRPGGLAPDLSGTDAVIRSMFLPADTRERPPPSPDGSRESRGS